MEQEIQMLKKRIDDLETQLLTSRENKYIDLDNIEGMIDTFYDSTPDRITDSIPTNVNEQIKLYTNGATKRLYIYDLINNAWRYVNLT